MAKKTETKVSCEENESREGDDLAARHRTRGGSV
jgi:hypothetical protein